GAEGGDLVTQLLRRPRREPHLEVRHAHRAVLVEGVDDLLRWPRPRVLRQLPVGVADVQHLGDDADVERRTGPHAVTLLLDEGDRGRHLLPRGALWDPTVPACR